MKLRLVALVLVSLFAVACESDTGGTTGHGGNGDEDTIAENDANLFADTNGGNDTSSHDDTTTPDTATPDTTAPDTTTPDGTQTDTVIDVPNTDTQTGLACKDLYIDCAPSCPTDANGQPTQECLQACKDQLSPEGLTAFDNWNQCLSANGCSALTDEAAMQDCIDQNCSNEYLACFHGDLSCNDMMGCLNGCPDNDNNCTSGCFANASVDAQSQYQAIGQCAQGNGCMALTGLAQQNCLLDKCASEWDGCFQGALNCAGLLQCFNGCGATDDACMMDCLSNTKATSQKAYYAIGACIQQQCCPTDPNQCQGTAYQTCAQGAYSQPGAPCYDLAAACMSGGAFLPGGLRLPISVPASAFFVR